MGSKFDPSLSQKKCAIQIVLGEQSDQELFGLFYSAYDFLITIINRLVQIISWVFQFQKYGSYRVKERLNTMYTGFPQALEIMENLEIHEKSSMHGKIMEFEKN